MKRKVVKVTGTRGKRAHKQRLIAIKRALKVFRNSGDKNLPKFVD
jgi:hypothetical protein